MAVTKVGEDDRRPLPGRKARLGLDAQRRPGRGARAPRRPAASLHAAQLSVERGAPALAEAPRRPPDVHQARHQIPSRPSADELQVAVDTAQPDRHAEGQVKRGAPAGAGPLADRARRRLPERSPLVIAPRHDLHVGAPIRAGHAPLAPKVRHLRSASRAPNGVSAAKWRQNSGWPAGPPVPAEWRRHRRVAPSLRGGAPGHWSVPNGVADVKWRQGARHAGPARPSQAGRGPGAGRRAPRALGGRPRTGPQGP